MESKNLLRLQPVICGLWQIVSMEKRGELDEERAVDAMKIYTSKRFNVRKKTSSPRRFETKNAFQNKKCITGMGYGRSLRFCRDNRG